MSKEIKQMQMDSLRAAFKDVRDLVVLTATGVDSQTDNHLRLTLRKKNIRMQVVKNSLCRRVFDELGMQGDGFWEGSTVVAWGANSLAELTRSVDGEIKKLAKAKDKFKPKGAISEGQRVSFEQALKMPTRAEAIGRVVNLILSPASRVVGQLTGAGSRLAAQLKTLSEKEEGTPAPEAQPAS